MTPVADPPAAPPAPGPCAVCGSSAYASKPVLWAGLVREWGLSPAEAAYTDRQQGTCCQGCGCNLRSIALAAAVTRWAGYDGPFQDLVKRRAFRRLRVLEVNEAGNLTRFLAGSRHYLLARYPEYDMTRLKLADGSYDLVVHSDTLEHVPDPLAGLRECGRVLAPGGACCYTVPVIVGRLSRTREGLEPSYHGGEHDRAADYTVQTEFGADMWTLPLRAGFRECRIVTAEYPSAQALTCLK